MKTVEVQISGINHLQYLAVMETKLSVNCARFFHYMINKNYVNTNEKLRAGLQNFREISYLQIHSSLLYPP